MLQSGLNYSALLAGATGVPFAIGSGVAAAIGGRLVSRFGRQLIVLGLILVAVGLIGVVWMVSVHYGQSLGWWLILPLVVAGVGSGITISPNQTITLSEVPVSQGGTAGGLLQVGSRIGSAVGIAAVGSIFFATLASNHGDYGQALPFGIAISIAFVIVALGSAVADVVANRLKARRDAPMSEAQAYGSGRR
jgi:MFS family permease